MINEKDLNNQNLPIEDLESDENKELDDKNVQESEDNNEFKNHYEDNQSKDNYESIDIVYDENNNPIFANENTSQEGVEEVQVSEKEEIISENNIEEITELEEQELQKELSNNVEESDNKNLSDKEDLQNTEEEKSEDLEAEEEKSKDLETEEELDPSVKRFIDMEVINYDVHKLIHAKHLFSANEIVKTIKKELKVETFDELIKTVKGSKYNKLFEVLGYFLHFVYKNKLPNEKKDAVLSELNNEEIVCVYSFAILVSNELKEKTLVKELYKELKNIPYDNGFVLKFSSLIKKKHLKDEYESNDKKKKRIKKLVKSCKKFIKKETYNEVDECIIRYLFNIYGEFYIKKCVKLYYRLETKISVELKINCLLSLAKGYLKKTKYKKANRYFKQVLLLDNENYEALVGNLLVLNKCYSLEELLSKKKIAKIKGYNDFNSIITNSTNEALVAKSQEIEANEKKEKKKHLERKLEDLSKHISVVSIVLAFILIALNVYLNNTGVGIIGYILLALYVGSSFITTNIKSKIKSAIIKAVVSIILVVISIIL